jgi:NAD-dependent DNA ligase
MAQDVSEQLESQDFINQLTNEEFLRSIYGIGEKTVESMTTFFTTQDNLQLIEQLQQYGVNMDPKKYSDILKASDAK